MIRSRARAFLALVAALVVVMAGAFLIVRPGTQPVAPAADGSVLSVAEECQRALGYPARTSADRTWLRQCVHALTPPSPTPTPTLVPPSPTPGSTTPAPTTAPPTTVPPTTVPPSTAPPTTVPPTTAPPTGGWPGPDNTGVPAGTTLTTWTGSCVITTPDLVVDAKVLNCDVVVRAPGVSFTRSRINGTISNDPDDDASTFSLTDSEVNATPGAVRQVTGVAHNHFVMARTEVTGGNRGVYCQRVCLIQDSWIHGTRITANWHASAVRMEQGLTLVHNTLVCDAPVQADPEGSCSASLTGYGDYAPVRDNLIQGNYFAATQYAAYCAYGGSSKGKPFSDGAQNIQFVDNVFERGSLSTNGSCALWGPIGDWDPSKPGAVWSNNRYSTGELIPNALS